MIIQYCSDLHLEFKDNQRYIRANPLAVAGDILVLAGDIMLFSMMDRHNDFFDYISDHFALTYWVPGNHEYYHSDISGKSGFLKEKIRENVFLVNNCTIEHDDIRFLFSTLWSEIRPVNEWRIQNRLSDFQVISLEGKRFSVAAFNELHSDSIRFITKELENEWIGKTVVVTHHVPTFEQYPSKYKGDILNEAFATELAPLIEQTCPDFWIYGHHHTNTPPFKIGTTELITNQLGYVHYKEHLAFKGDQYFII